MGAYLAAEYAKRDSRKLLSRTFAYAGVAIAANANENNLDTRGFTIPGEVCLLSSIARISFAGPSGIIHPGSVSDKRFNFLPPLNHRKTVARIGTGPRRAIACPHISIREKQLSCSPVYVGGRRIYFHLTRPAGNHFREAGAIYANANCKL